MKSRRTFLQDLAADIHRKHSRLDEVTLVFPNRRAILYFRKYLGDLLDRPVFPPRMLTIEDFVSGYSNLRIPDRLELVYQLHGIYQRIVQIDGEPQDVFGGLDQFYFWGDMLLRDFDEIDKYLIDADLLFKDLSHQKELDSNFDYLTEEQREFIKGFWSNFDVDHSTNKRRFLFLWRKLADVYHGFTDVLRKQQLAYEGMIYREVARMADQDQLKITGGASLYYVGFNALTAAEEKIIGRAVLNGATVYWDVDAYYVNNARQEAGRFFREYQEHPVLKRTFPADIPSHGLLKGADESKKQPQIELFGAPQPIGQAKLLSQVLTERLAEGMKPEETLIVLPDEKLLLPVLHGIADNVDSMNVTMGFPLSSTPVFNFIEMLVDLQIARRESFFNHKQALALLGHPYVVGADTASSSSKRKVILRDQWVLVPESLLASEVPLHRKIFRSFKHGDSPMIPALIAYFQDVLHELGQLPHLGDLDREYAAHFVRFFNRLEEILLRNSGAEFPEDRDVAYQLKSFLRLFRQLIRSEKLPFVGEPLRGLQIMGVLETRNLDFRNVFILSMNEGAFPAFASSGSYIPYSLRKAYQLPTPEHQDAMYAYLFYRVLQRAENVSLFYNSETDVLGQGEMSRFLQQLLFESGIPVEKKLLYNPIAPQQIQPITVHKGPSVKDSLLRLNDGNRKFRGISPSALNTYLECRLKFYFRHIARIREADEVEEDLDARVLGNLVHRVMELFYQGLAERKGTREIKKSDYVGYEKTISRLIDEVFRVNYHLDPNKPVEYQGQRLVVREIVRRFAHRVIEVDQEYAPFTIEGLEQEDLALTVPLTKQPFQAVIGGKIDRVDRKDDLVRVIDYKTGKDKMNFESVASLFVRDAGRNKAAFQTILYALLYSENSSNGKGLRVVPGLFNRVNLFDEFSFGLKLGRDEVTDVGPLLPEFKANLVALLDEMYDPDVSFDQTADLENCRICPYSQICYR